MSVRRKREPVHRIFYLCSTFIPDEEWSEFLKDCSFGKFPRGVRFENGAIKCTRKNESFVTFIPKDTEKALKTILSVFRDRLKIKTKKEQRNATKKFNQYKNSVVINQWKDVKRKGIKQSMIKNFSQKFSETNFLSFEEQSELIILLTVGIDTNVIGNSDIIFENSNIVDIKRLKFDYHSRKLSLNGQAKRPRRTVTNLPLLFEPVPQINYDYKNAELLDYHLKKCNRLNLVK